MSNLIERLQELSDRTRKFGVNYVAMYESDKDLIDAAIAELSHLRELTGLVLRICDSGESAEHNVQAIKHHVLSAITPPPGDKA